VLTAADLAECEELIDELTRFAMDRIVSERPAENQISTKRSAADWVTETDLAVERHVRAAIHERFPQDSIVGEEYGSTDADEPRATWYVDPVDGTTNFVHGLPWSSFSIAAVDEEGAAVGAVADPYRREVLSAARGRGARRNGEPTSCIATDTLVGGIFLTELSSQSLWPGQTALMGSLADADCVTRIMGSNALSLASVGAGRVLATVIGEFGPVDCHAGTLIALESGAAVRSRSGQDRPVLGEGVLCASPGVVDELYELWERADDGR
jgi:fructose-1,6-bisphosphatase/inositol monophosphatase family enzyme